MFVQASTGLVLKVWYEDAWDVFETKDLIMEEINSYLINPQSYVQSQIGIRWTVELFTDSQTQDATSQNTIG